MIRPILINARGTTSSENDTRHTVSITTQYTRRPDETGWLAVRLEPSGRIVSLCEFTKVLILGSRGGRTFFRIADGNGSYVGMEASLRDENAARYLSGNGPSSAATIVATYDGLPSNEYSPIRRDTQKHQWADISFNGLEARVTLNSVWGREYTPIPAGQHRIMAPDYSHANISTEGYRMAHPGQVSCTDVWFPIALEGSADNSSRYIHIGHLSEGCVTIYELLKWNALYDYLINKRIPHSQGKFIGTLIVES